MPWQPYYPDGYKAGQQGGTPITHESLNRSDEQYQAALEDVGYDDEDGSVALARDTQAVGGAPASGIARIATGSYVGNGSTSDRLIHVGFAPLMVYVVGNSPVDLAGLGLGMAGATHGIAKPSNTFDLRKESHGNGWLVPVPTENGFIVRSEDGRANLNHNGVTYTWVAIGAVGS